jgi:hypothetical protein
MATYPPLATSVEYNAAQDGDPETFLKAAAAAVRKACGWHIAPIITQEVVLDGYGGVEIDLPTLRLRNLLRVTNDGSDIDVATIDASPDGTIALTSGCWSRRLGGIRITMEHGYDIDDVADIQNLIVSIAARAAVSPNGVVQEATGSVNIRFSTFGGGASGGVALMSHERELLDSYRLTGGR